MELADLLKRLTKDERSTLIARRLGENATPLSDRALVEQLQYPASLKQAMLDINVGQLAILRWLSARPDHQAPWSDFVSAVGHRLPPALCESYLADLRLLGLLDYQTGGTGDFVATFSPVAAATPRGHGISLWTTLEQQTTDNLSKIAYGLGLHNLPSRKDDRAALIVRTLTSQPELVAILGRLSPQARSVFDWVRQRDGSVDVTSMVQHVGARSRAFQSGYGPIGPVWMSPPQGQTLDPLSELVRHALVVPVNAHSGSWYAPSAFAIPDEVEEAFSGQSPIDRMAMTPPPLQPAEPENASIPSPSGVLRDLGHLLGFIATGRGEWRQDGEPYKRSLVAFGKSVGVRGSDYPEQLWEYLRHAGLVRVARRGDFRYTPVGIGEESPSALFGRLVLAWIGGRSSMYGFDGELLPHHRAHMLLLRLLVTLPPDTWVTRASVQAQLRFHWPLVFAPEYQPMMHMRPPEPDWDGLGSLLLAHATGADGQPAVMMPLAHQQLLDPDHHGLSDQEADLPPWESAWVIQPDRSIVVPPNAHPETLTQLWQVASLESNQGASLFRVTAASVAGALNRGLTPTRIREILASGSRVPLPPTVERLVEDQGNRYGRIKVGAAATYVQTDDPALLEQLKRDRKLGKLVWKDVAPGIAFVTGTRPDAVLDILRQADYLPVKDEPKTPDRAPASPATGKASPKGRERKVTASERKALVRVVNQAVQTETALIATWTDGAGTRTSELEVVDTHGDVLHAIDLQDHAEAEIMVPFGSIVSLKKGDALYDGPYDPYDDAYDDEEL
ncbi:MAG: helicase-associated domain-containing protein [Chloroflexota bacterium]